MNRKQRRNISPSLTKEQVEIFERITKAYKPIAEGTKVKLNYNAISAYKDWNTMQPKYKQWVEDNKDKIFTVEFYSNDKDNPTVVCLKEDEAKWGFWTGDLTIVNETEIRDIKDNTIS